MMAPGQIAQCVGCSLEVDHIEGLLVHLQNHDVSYAVVARAPIDEIEAIRKRMGWRFTWVSSFRSDFNYDFGVSFTPEQIAAGRAFYNYEYVDPGLEDRSGDSVFFKDDGGRIFHTYSTYGRGGEEFLGVYRYLDTTPKGRSEKGPYNTLADWVKPRNMYGKGGLVEGSGRYHRPECACAVHASSADLTELERSSTIGRSQGMITGLRGATIWSADLNNLLPFYRDVLQLPVVANTARFVVLGRGESPALALGTHSEVHGRNADPARHMVALTSDDITADWKRLRDAGVEFVEDPTDYGRARVATFKDPEGNLLQLLQFSA